MTGHTKWRDIIHKSDPFYVVAIKRVRRRASSIAQAIRRQRTAARWLMP